MEDSLLADGGCLSVMRRSWNAGGEGLSAFQGARRKTDGGTGAAGERAHDRTTTVSRTDGKLERGRQEGLRGKMRRDAHEDSPKKAERGEEKHVGLLVRLYGLRGEGAQGRSAQRVAGESVLTGTVGGHDDFLA